MMTSADQLNISTNPCDIAIEIDGEPYIGRFVLRGSIVIVTSQFGTRAAEFGNVFPDTMARNLLHELVIEGLSDG